MSSSAERPRGPSVTDELPVDIVDVLPTKVRLHMPPSSAELVIDFLRRATRPHHDAIESLLRLEDATSLAHYVNALRGFAAFLSAWEPRVRDALPERLHTWLAGRSRLALVQRDLAHFAADPVGDRPIFREDERASMRTAAAQASVAAIPLGSLAEAFGSLYVIEGSNLGGQLIARRMAERFGLDAQHGTAFFTGFGAATAAHWRAFRSQLEIEVGDEPPAREAAGCAAGATFDALASTFRAVPTDEPLAA